MAFNVVEFTDTDDAAFDQPCKFGHRFEGHAVYCHADHWTESPRKCRRTWYTGGETKDEDCPGYQPNPEFRGTPDPTPLVSPCSKCKGLRYLSVTTIKDRISTCGHCMGDGNEPIPIQFTDEQANILSDPLFDKLGIPYMVLAETDATREAVDFLASIDCIEIRTVAFRPWGTAYLVSRTPKGHHLLSVFWDSPEYKRRVRNEDRRRARYAKKHRYDPPNHKYPVFGTQILCPAEGVRLDDAMRFDCENRAVDYFAGKLTEQEVREAFENRADKSYEYYTEVRGGLVGIAYRRLQSE